MAELIRPGQGVAEESSREGLLFGAFAIFFLAFVMSGNANAIPQMFFQRFYPHQKNLLLSISLLLATVAGTLAVILSKRFRLSTSQLLTAMLTTVIVTLLLYSTGRVPLFIGAIVVIQFAVFYLTNLLDYASVARAGTLRGFNDAAGVIARLFGTLSAPAFFPSFYDNKVIALSCSGFLGVLAIIGAARLLRMPVLLDRAEAAGDNAEKSPDRTDQLFFSFAVSIYISLTLFGANMFYLLRDRLHIAHAETRGGMAIAAMFVCAIVFNSLVALLHRRRAESRNRLIRMGPLALPAVMLCIFGMVIGVGLPITYELFLTGACLLGAAYGVFVWEVRDYTSRGAQHEGKSTLVTWFNNIGNVSALIAFGLMLAFAAHRAAAAAGYYLKITSAISCAPILGLLLLYGAHILTKSQTRIPADLAEQAGS
jgi:hypothetical protein